MSNEEHPIDRWTSLPEAVGDAYRRVQLAQERRGRAEGDVAIGFPSLDRALGPLRPGDLVVVTACGQAEWRSFLAHCATHQSGSHAVAVLCLGGTVERMVQIVLAARAEVPLARLDAGGLEKSSHWPALADAVERYHCLPVFLLAPEIFELGSVRESLQGLLCGFPHVGLLVVDDLGRVAPDATEACLVLRDIGQEHGLVVVAGASSDVPVGERDGDGLFVGSEPVALGVVRAIVQVQAPRTPVPGQAGWAPVHVQVLGDHRGAVSRVRLEHDPVCQAWREPPVAKASAGGEDPVFRREGKELDAVYSAACCALLHEVGLGHFWDGQPHGPGRAWDLPHNECLSDEQRLVVRVALDIWDNQGGVLLRDLRKLPASMVADVGELIADTASVSGPLGWVERHLGDGWDHWMAEGRWEELLGAGWRELLGRSDDEAPV